MRTGTTPNDPADSEPSAADTASNERAAPAETGDPAGTEIRRRSVLGSLAGAGVAAALLGSRPGVEIAAAVDADGEMAMGTNHWDVAWGGADPFEDGYGNVTGSNPWRRDFLEEMETYVCQRPMDWNRTNNAQADHPGTNWSDRVRQEDEVQAPMAYEWQIDACNRTETDYWVTVPHFAGEDEEYLSNLAELVHEELDEDLAVYVEYSNETWNEIFDQHRHCVDRGVALDLPGGTEERRGWTYHAYAAANCFEAFEEAFGADNSRLNRVVAGFAAWSAPAGRHLSAWDDPAVNPGDVGFDKYALAPYIGGSSTEEVMDDVDEAVANMEEHRNLLDSAGYEDVDLIVYEGGQHVTENAEAVNADEEMYDVYVQYFDAMADVCEGVFAHYTHSGNWSDGGAWGAKRQFGGEVTHKYQAILDWTGEHRNDGTDGDGSEDDNNGNDETEGGNGGDDGSEDDESDGDDSIPGFGPHAAAVGGLSGAYLHRRSGESDGTAADDKADRRQ